MCVSMAVRDVQLEGMGGVYRIKNTEMPQQQKTTQSNYHKTRYQLHLVRIDRDVKYNYSA